MGKLRRYRHGSEVIDEARTKTYKCRVALRGDIVRDDSGCYAVFTEQRSSASQMTAAKVMDVIARPPGCAGQAADAVSAYTQVKVEDATYGIKNSKVRMSRYLDTSTKTQMAKSWSSMEDPVVPPQRNLYGYLLAGLLWERQFKKVDLENGWKKFQVGNTYS